MTTAVQRRRGTKTEHESFTGLEGEITVNTTNESLHVHDGSTTGGFETMRADGSNATSLNLNSTTNVDGVIDDDTLATASATKLATSESIKAYVDNQVGTVDTLSEILDNGNTSGASDIIISSGQSLTADTISETTVDAGVTIDSVLLKDNSVSAASIDINSSTVIDGVLDEDTLVSDSATKLATQQSIKAYVDSKPAVTDGDKGDVVVSSSGSVWTVESAAGDFDVTGALDVSGAASFTTIDTSDAITVSNDTPVYILEESDAPTTFNRHWHVLAAGGNYRMQTRTSADVLVSVDYKMDKDASGATDHIWSIAGTEKLSLASTGLNVTDKLLVGTALAEAKVNIATTQQFDPTASKTTNAISIIQEGGTQANGNYSTGITFSKINSSRPGGAIVSKQTSSDSDQLGLAFFTHGSSTGTNTLNERAVLDHNGNFLVAKTGNAIGTVGVEARASGQIYSTVSGSQCLELNRLTSAGNIVRFWNYTSVVGTIGSNSGNSLYIGSSGVGTSYVRFFNGTMRPATSSGANNDNAMDLGASVARWDDVYATNGTIQTSDEREKQDIQELSEAERSVAVAAKGLLRKFRWKDAVAEKGDDARIHFGIIAQDLKAAFEAEGLDAGNYAMFINSEWWEHEVSVPAVEAQDAVYETVVDDDGSESQVLVSEAVEAQEAYTRTDTYETEAEAPEGAVKKDQMGVRYSELLAFIIAAL